MRGKNRDKGAKMTELPNKTFLRPDEVAAFWRVHVKTVYRWIDLGIMPAERKGRTLRVRYEDAKKGESPEEQSINTSF